MVEGIHDRLERVKTSQTTSMRDDPLSHVVRLGIRNIAQEWKGSYQITIQTLMRICLMNYHDNKERDRHMMTKMSLRELSSRCHHSKGNQTQSSTLNRKEGQRWWSIATSTRRSKR
jgi:hypothetical protein